VADPQKANALKQSLDYLDSYLEKTPYAAGDTLTIADFALLATVTQLEGVDYSYKAYSNLYKWVEKLKNELPYYHQCSDEGIQMFREWAKTKIRYIFNLY
jgi:glutathione S-transferase